MVRNRSYLGRFVDTGDVSQSTTVDSRAECSETLRLFWSLKCDGGDVSASTPQVDA